MSFVPPSGPVPCDYVICGEAPAREEVRERLGFVGPSGKMLWPVLRRLAGLNRSEVYVTNLSKVPVDNDADVKFTDEEFARWRDELISEMGRVRPRHVLAVGAWAARAFLPDYQRMEVHNGMTYDTGLGYTVTPCWHPAAALHGDVGKDPLAWMGDAIAHFHPKHQRFASRVAVPEYCYKATLDGLGTISIDTEGTPDAPICLTWACRNGRFFMWPKDVPWFMQQVHSSGTMVVYHNAPYDWGMIEAMGYANPHKLPFRDTMEIAYLRQTEPQGLKDLSLRWLGLHMTHYEDLVTPYYTELMHAIRDGYVEAEMTMTTHSPKTGKAYKTPKVEYGANAKLFRKLKDPDKIREKLGPEFPGPSLRMVPEEKMLDYATLDPYATFHLWERLGIA